MASITFTGIVSGQAGPSIVTLSVASETEQFTFTATTLADGSYSYVAELAPGDYIAQASVEEDELYKAASSGAVPFVVESPPVEKLDRTITLNVA